MVLMVVLIMVGIPRHSCGWETRMTTEEAVGVDDVPLQENPVATSTVITAFSRPTGSVAIVQRAPRQSNRLMLILLRVWFHGAPGCPWKIGGEREGGEKAIPSIYLCEGMDVSIDAFNPSWINNHQSIPWWNELSDREQRGGKPKLPPPPCVSFFAGHKA